MERYNGPILGIDLGTTNSAIAIAKEKGKGRVRASTIKVDRYAEYAGRTKKWKKDDILPSAVLYPEGEDPMVGDIAINQLIAQPYNVICSVKSQMGNSQLRETGGSIKDKKPEEVSARILKHLLSQAEKIYCEEDEKVEKVVITVPASFNFAQRAATKEAGKLAGVEVHLISEPQAAAYSLINQLENDDIDLSIDFSETKRIMVFDIGGGTLDITLQDIVCDENNNYIMNPIATNRYSKIAGDKFDEMLAEYLYKLLLEDYGRVSMDNEKEIKREKNKIMQEIKFYAEDIKKEISNSYIDKEMQKKKLSKNEEFECGGLIMDNYTLNGYMTVEEFEQCLEPLMGRKYTYNDYKKIPNITDTENIIYPVMDVLFKASEKLGVDNVKVDGIVLNGGMSRLYLIKNRLEEFFGQKTISVTDPDRSVAEGAAIYHYYQNYKLGLDFYDNTSGYEGIVDAQNNVTVAIESKGDVIADSIYLGMTDGVNRILIDRGTRLPYNSKKIKGFGLKRNTTEMAFPINHEVHGKYETIAIGKIKFNHCYTVERDVAIEYYMNQEQQLFFKAWINDGDNIIEGETTISLGGTKDNTLKSKKSKLMPPKGTKIENINDILSQLKNLCCNELANANKKNKKNKKDSRDKIWNNIKTTRNMICSCGNPEDFAKPMLNELKKISRTEYVHTLLRISRCISDFWADEYRTELCLICEKLLKKNNLRIYKSMQENIQINIEAIKIIGKHGNDNQIAMLNSFDDKSIDNKYCKALIYAYSNAGINKEWVINNLSRVSDFYDVDTDTISAIYKIMMDNKIDDDDLYKIRKVLETTLNGRLKMTVIGPAIIAFGYSYIGTSDEIPHKVIDSLMNFYSRKEYKHFENAIRIAKNLIDMGTISDEDMKYEKELFNYSSNDFSE